MKTATSRTIGEAYKAFEAAFHRGDADAISRMYTEDAELLIPEAPIFRGREAIRGVWANIVGSGGNTVRVATLELQDAGDWTYDVGTFQVSGPSGDVLNAGKFIVIWKRETTGETRIHRDIFNWDIPPARSTP
jgi:ketosteroid isomerase-like protein